MSVLEKVKREISTVSTFRRMNKWVGDLDADSDVLVADDLEASVDKHRDLVAFRFEGKVLTYGEFDAFANKVANWAIEQGLKPGDAVALFMENRPEYVGIWYGLSKIGVVSALINHNLEDEGLAHCVNIAESKLVICGAEQDEAIATVTGKLENDPPVWSLGGNAGRSLSDALQHVSDKRPDRSFRQHLRGKDLCLYVYTSGTTGLPKAARLTQVRTQGMMRSFIAPCKLTSRDRVYITLPLYHGTGGVCGIGMALYTGASVILRRKFSASAFWDDCADYGATAIVYIGELCRYLLNSPAHPKERAHRIRTGFGNGLRPEVWGPFLERFNIPHLCEFYGSTEGNVSFANYDGKVGAVGRIPPYLKSAFEHIAFVKFDVENEEPVRGEDGLCVRAEPGEPAEALGRIGQEARQRFEGYNDESATQKKILRDVFEPGDMWFRTGDLMKTDAEGYIYFVDRIGDTFRWKGENVATNEVGEALSRYPGLATANVYGAPVPGADGKAGMAAITVKDDMDFAGLHAFLEEHLPSYAIPLFIRVQKEAETTGTFKYRKVELVKEGFDPDKTGEPVWFAHPEKKEYVPLTADEYQTIISGGYRF